MLFSFDIEQYAECDPSLMLSTCLSYCRKKRPYFSLISTFQFLLNAENVYTLTTNWNCSIFNRNLIRLIRPTDNYVTESSQMCWPPDEKILNSWINLDDKITLLGDDHWLRSRSPQWQLILRACFSYLPFPSGTSTRKKYKLLWKNP